MAIRFGETRVYLAVLEDPADTIRYRHGGYKLISKKQEQSPEFPPIIDPHEWIFFDWQNGLIVRNVELGIANSTEFRMPDEFRIKNGCQVVRLDTGERIESPRSYLQSTVTPRLYFRDFFDGLIYVETQCAVTTAALPLPNHRQ